MGLTTISKLILLLLALGAVAACTTQPTRVPTDTGDTEARASEAAAAGNYAEARALYVRLAAQSRGSQRADYLILAARSALHAGDTEAARSLVNEALPVVTASQQNDATVLLARIDLELEPATALARLDGLRAPVATAVSVEADAIRGQALFELGRPAEAIRVLSDREIWLDTAEALAANQRLIWDGLAADPRGARFTGDDLIDGWLALAPLTARVDEPIEFRRGLIEWRRRFASHPAASGVLAEILAAGRAVTEAPQRIALLLPLSSTRRTAALAVRDGFIAAHLAGGTADSDTSISVYDTSIRGTEDAYLQAQLDGADFIVGPLLADSVERMVPQAGFIPTLALNFSRLDINFPRTLYQFALSPEDEARAIAERAYAAGQRTAVALFASNDRGYRVMNSFRETFEALGGTVLASVGYVPESQNFSGPISDVLNIARSQQRHQRLQANLGVPVMFEFRRRADIDMIFLQAEDASLGRLIVPQLRFYEAGDVPTYATSDIYDPSRRASDADLNGVMFPDLPLLLTPDGVASDLTQGLQSYWPQRARQYIRFYSFGFDAYHLVGRIYNPRQDSWPLRGTTGELTVDALGRVHRALPFAQFRNGEATAIAPIPVPALPFPEAIDASGDLVGAR